MQRIVLLGKLFSRFPDNAAQRVADALERLSPEEFQQLCGYIRVRLFPVLLYLRDYEVEDLLQEVFTRTIARARNWPPEVSFKTYLIKTADSIADGLYKKHSRRADWKDWNAYQQVLEHKETDMYAQYRLDRLRLRLSGDRLAIDVLNSRLEGYKPAEACEMLGIGTAVYQAARKRILRAWEEVNRDE